MGGWHLRKDRPWQLAGYCKESPNEFLARGSTRTRCWQSHAPPDLPAPTLCSQAAMPRRSFTGPPSSKCDIAILRSRSSFSWTKARSSFRMGSTSACEAATALFASSRIRSSRRRFTRCTSAVEKDCFGVHHSGGSLFDTLHPVKLNLHENP